MNSDLQSAPQHNIQVFAEDTLALVTIGAAFLDGPGGVERMRLPETINQHDAVVQLLEIDGEFAKVRPIARQFGYRRTGVCHTGFFYPDVRVELWVATKDLAPVLTRTVALRFDDGTGIQVAAGTAVKMHEDRPVAVLVDRAWLEIELPADAVGTRFVSDREFLALQREYFKLSPPKFTSYVDPEARGKCFTNSYTRVQVVLLETAVRLTFNHRLLPRSWFVDELIRSEVADWHDRLDATTQVTLDTRCVRWTLLAQDVGEFEVPDFERWYVKEPQSRRNAEQPTLSSVIPLFWEDGERAGQLLDDFESDDSMYGLVSQRCIFDYRQELPRLCARPADVNWPVQKPEADLVWGSITRDRPADVGLLVENDSDPWGLGLGKYYGWVQRPDDVEVEEPMTQSSASVYGLPKEGATKEARYDDRPHFCHPGYGTITPSYQYNSLKSWRVKASEPTHRKAIKKVLEMHLKSRGYCFRYRLTNHKKLDVRFKIAPGGRVELVSQLNEVDGFEQVLSCMISPMASWRFPVSTDGIVFDVSLEFGFRY